MGLYKLNEKVGISDIINTGASVLDVGLNMQGITEFNKYYTLRNQQGIEILEWLIFKHRKSVLKVNSYNDLLNNYDTAGIFQNFINSTLNKDGKIAVVMIDKCPIVFYFTNKAIRKIYYLEYIPEFETVRRKSFKEWNPRYTKYFRK